jgi:carboxymethylenebutenolidase
MNKIAIATRDGTCQSYVFHPTGPGPWPAVLVFMDGVGIRPAMLELGERLATHGYFVLLPDLFYRSGPYEPMDAKTVFTDPEKRKALGEKFALATQANVMSDTGAFLDYLATDPRARPGGIGTTGYCMGGLMSMTAAGARTRIASSPPLRITPPASRPTPRRARTASRRRSARASTSPGPSRILPFPTT